MFNQQQPGMPPQGPMPPGFAPGIAGAPGAPQMPPPGSMPPPQAGAAMAQPSPMAGTAAPGQIDPATVQAMMQLQQQQPKQQAAQRQLALAEALRGDAAGQMKGTQAGRVYVAPGLANLGANIAGNYMAQRKEKGAEDSLAKLGEERTGALSDYFKALSSGLRG